MTGITESGQEAVLSVNGLRVWNERSASRVVISEDIDLAVSPGESIAIVGESGSGKSVAARAMLGLLPESLRAEGRVDVTGKAFLTLRSNERRRMRGSEIAFVMQDPFTMLNPLLRIGVQVTAALEDDRGRPLGRTARREQALARLAEVGISDPAVAEKYPFQLSGGMLQRVAIAAAIAESPRVLIADEPTTALDVTTQREVLELLDQLRRSHRMALVLITHDLRVAFSTCDRVYVMYAGEIVEAATARSISHSPRHPYTAALLAADPPIDRRLDRILTIPGSVPPPGQRSSGCRFAPRCGFARPECDERPVELLPDARSQLVRCRRVDSLSLGSTRPTSAPRSSVPPAGAPSAERVISLRGVRKTYGSKVAVDSADIDVAPGESVGLVGESGSGKTTLARMMLGLVRPDAGSASVGGVDLARRRATKEEWALVRATVQMAFQDPHSTLNPSRTVGATLRDGLRLAGADDKHGAQELLERVGLPASYAERRPGQLSGGERQRVAIARALSRRPRVVVCDEVVSALDVSAQGHILNLLRDLQAELGLSYVFITHDLAVVRQVTDRIYVLNSGKIVESGPTADVLDDPSHDYTKKLIASIPGDHGRRRVER